MLDARFTHIALELYCAIYEDRDWDCYYQLISDKPWMNTSFEVIRWF